MAQNGSAHTLSAPDARIPFSSRMANAAFVLGSGAAYIAFSAGLILFNKHLMHKDRFPFAGALVACHMLMAMLALGTLYLCAGYRAFPAMKALREPEADSKVSLGKTLWTMVPVGFLMAASLVLSNMAYLHASVSFLQLMKELNMVLVFFLSVMAGLDFMDRGFSILLLITAGCIVSVSGNFATLSFTMIAFVIQSSSQVCECARVVCQNYLLSSKGTKLDPLTYTLLVAPLCVLFVGLSLVAFNFGQLAAIVQGLRSWWQLIALNSLVALGLNISIAVFIKNAGGVGFILAGVTKDCLIVVFSCAFMGDALSTQQVVGFAIALTGIFLYSLRKSCPDLFTKSSLSAVGLGFMEPIVGCPEAKKVHDIESEKEALLPTSDNKA